MKTIVVGSGFGGLAAAILLAKDGHDVTILEKNDHIGGRASLLQKDGFVWDMGPSRYLMPDIFEKFFEMVGEKVEDYLTLEKLSPQYRIFFDEDTNEEGPSYIEITGDIKKDLETIEKIEPGVSDKFMEYLQSSEVQYNLGMEFVYKNYDTIRDFFTRDLATKGLKLKVFQTFAKYVERYFKTSKLQKIVQYPLVFLGTDPLRAPALYNIMTHVDFNLGLFYPQGGIYEIVRALEKITKKYDIQIVTDAEVNKINIDPTTKKATSVETTKGRFDTELVVCNADMGRAETQLLEQERQTYPQSYWDKRVLAPSAFIMYLGIEGKVDNLLHHTLIFSKDWKRNFDEIFEEGTLSEEPSLYICTPSKTDPSVAPEGDENMFILVPIPPRIEIDQATQDQYEQHIFDFVEKACHISLRDRIKSKTIFHIENFKGRYNALGGTALGLSHTLMQTAIFRPNNFSKKVKNLFYVGHHTNPGIGMPMVMISGMLVRERVANAIEKGVL